MLDKGLTGATACNVAGAFSEPINEVRENLEQFKIINDFFSSRVASLNIFTLKEPGYV